MSDDSINLDDYGEIVTVTCPECGTEGDVPAVWGGLMVECKDCDARFEVPDANGGGA